MEDDSFEDIKPLLSQAQTLEFNDLFQLVESMDEQERKDKHAKVIEYFSICLQRKLDDVTSLRANYVKIKDSRMSSPLTEKGANDLEEAYQMLDDVCQLTISYIQKVDALIEPFEGHDGFFVKLLRTYNKYEGQMNLTDKQIAHLEELTDRVYTTSLENAPT